MVWVLSLKQKNFVCIDNDFSEAGIWTYSGQQGSVPGLLGVSLYVYNLPQSLREAGSYLYVDDTWGCSKNWKYFNKEF